MADPKPPDDTRPFPPRPARENIQPIPPLTDRTEPITQQGSEVTRPTISITRPTVAFPRETTRPISPVTKSATRSPVVGKSSARNPVTGKSVTGTRTPAVRRTGANPRVSQAAAAAVRPDLVTEGMKARRREIERKKRRAALERMRMEEELGEGWRRVFKTSGFLILALALVYGYWRVQQSYGDRWPLMLVWMVMATCILTGFGWVLWYMSKSDI